MRPPTPSPGDVLAGKYRVERVIGQGGMGVVVAARHVHLDQLVALKFSTVETGAAAARFVREAKSAVRLRSEHVAKVTDVGTLENGAPYMVMEYLEGQDLSAVVESHGALPVADAVGYVVQACEAVAEAHALGIVHRDLKPHNLFLTTGVSGLPKVKVLDFGISKTMDSELALTRTAEIMGTPSYMSPEQLRSAKDVDLRADIWALGVILYELLTARLPFEAENLPQLCTMVATEPPVAPSVHRPDLPKTLCDTVLRCLERKPEGRFVDAAALVTALAPFAPDWSLAARVQLVPRSTPSARAVISVTPSKGGMTDPAWSETELAPRARSWAIIATRAGMGAVVAGAALMVGVRFGDRHVSRAPEIASGGPAVGAQPAPIPREAAAVAHVEPSSATLPTAPVASSAPQAQSVRPPVTTPPRSRAKAALPAASAGQPSDDVDPYKDRH